jgi:hypothetical protein
MRRRMSLAIEGLEERALLSSLAYSLTTDRSNYRVGQPVEMTFTETNTGDQPVTVGLSPTDFSVSQSNEVIWQSDPTDAGQPPMSETLLPGQSVSQTASWDGTTVYDVPSFIGGSQQSSQINVFGSFVVSNLNAPHGPTASFQIANPMVSTVTTDQPVYQLGEPVQLTFTEVNSSDQSITIPVQQPAGFGITHNGTPVLVDLEPAIYLSGTETIAPGQGFTTSQTWNGIPDPWNVAPPTWNESSSEVPITGPTAPGGLTGTFVVEYGPTASGTNPTTIFQIDAPSPGVLATSVSTNQTTYQPGQPVNMTFTETNVGNQPVAVLTGATEFQITQNGTASPGTIIDPDQAIQASAWLTLQPGQSYSQTATWNGLPPLASGTAISLTAPFTISDDFDPNADTATFQYAVPPSSVLQTSVTTNQSVYQLGQPIQITFTETNLGMVPIQVWEGPSSFDVAQNGTGVWSSLVADNYPNQVEPGSFSWVMLQPGQSFTQTEAWKGVPDKLPSPDLSGTFTVSNGLDLRPDTATFQIIAPPTSALTSTITTNRAVYDLGSPAVFMFTETNTSDQPVPVLTGPDDFVITSDGDPVWWYSTYTSSVPPSATWQTLQPGQSYSQTVTLDYPTVGAGTYSVSDMLDPNGSSATIQILPASQGTQLNPPPPISGPLPTQPISNPPPSSPASVGPIAATLSTAPSYKLGQKVPLALILKDVSAGKVAIKQSRHVETVTINHGSTMVYESARRVHSLASWMIRSGHPLIFRTLWSGKPNQAGVERLSPGVYAISVDYDGYAAATTVDLVPRHKQGRPRAR